MIPSRNAMTYCTNHNTPFYIIEILSSYLFYPHIARIFKAFQKPPDGVFAFSAHSLYNTITIVTQGGFFVLDLELFCKDLKRSRSPIRKTGNRLILQLFTILHTPSPQTKTLLAQWMAEFQTIYGDIHLTLSGNRKLDTAALFREFGIPAPTHEEQAVLLLFFSIQTFFSLLLKQITYQLLPPSACPPETLISASFTKEYGISNYCEEDCFLWPMFELEQGVLPILEELEQALIPYHIPSNQPPMPYHRDLLKQVYHALIPKPLRHALGEFYTPDWLACLVWQETMELTPTEELASLRVLDPTCGSGTFLVEAIHAKRKSGCTLPQLLDTVCGIDINPLAVLTAKTNLLLCISDLLDSTHFVNLPIYRADILSPPDNIPQADLILGNPPWINWEYLPEHYRLHSQHLWQDYHLFVPHGKGVRFIKEDISILITYLVMDRLLKPGGLLAFVLRQGIFKSAQNGAAFRQFRLPDGQRIGVLRVDDFSKLRVFDHAAGSTAVFFAQKGIQTRYPLPYIRWEKNSDAPHGAVRPHCTLEQVLAHTHPHKQQAMPAQADDPCSLWITAEAQSMDSYSTILGQNNYKARTGIFTGGANAVYWLNILGRENQLLRVENIVQRAKRKVPQIQTCLEPDYLFPLVRGSDLQQWKVSYSAYLLCPHTPQSKMHPVPWQELSVSCPASYRYLSGFRSQLDQRQGFAGWEKEIQQQNFHAVLKVGEYTFAPYKVVWRYIASRFICAVLEPVEDPWLGTVLPLPNEKVMYISTHCREEAYYLCALLSSIPVTRCIQSYMNPTSISAHVLSKLRLPDFDPHNPVHLELAQLCKEGHLSREHSSYLAQISAITATLYMP